MSSGAEKVKLHIVSGGERVEDNNGWDYVCSDQSVRHAVQLRANITHESLLGYVKRKCGIEGSVGVTRLVYKNDGSMFELTDDEDVCGFMQFASESNRPPVLFVYVDILMCD